jgi:hypothetical protein
MTFAASLAGNAERGPFILEFVAPEVKPWDAIQGDLCLASPRLAFGEKAGKHHEVDP